MNTWLDLTAGAFDTAAADVQLGLFAAPDPTGTLPLDDMTNDLPPGGNRSCTIEVSPPEGGTP